MIEKQPADPHLPVIKNIERAVQDGRFNDKVEVNDPTLAPDAEKAVINHYLASQNTWRHRVNNVIVRTGMNLSARWLGHGIAVTGREHLAAVPGAAIVTSNHFSPVENLIVRKALGMPRLFIVSQTTNLEMPGTLGYVFNNADILPISGDLNYLAHEFPTLLDTVLDRQHKVLIYPEQEMWYNYRKPRPPKRGAYYYAARFNVPVISCFVAIHTLAKQVSPAFNKVSYSMQIMPSIFPDPTKSVRENSLAMMKQDYRQKCQAYERAYHRKLTYQFSQDDIAGWRGKE
ncbi:MULTISPECIES: 1-acyl-sn-glycerol-3-phosphate acyltransferase [Lacticaseibacillus]|uniref:1-acyl-sn-glycerol-3-phosphate acyltransferase n=1 Tax=Lacticaseibacillus hegangensis TaxID=2486010 RepID=A0ABW4CSL5_9LACO|nr:MULTISPECIES: 1-acyl-sn-glycerol-3-phosphate acyltransferase [Lacticaseibacillus]